MMPRRYSALRIEPKLGHRRREALGIAYSPCAQSCSLRLVARPFIYSTIAGVELDVAS